jgi:hypothetical protein
MKKLKTLYQVCPNEASGWGSLHDNLVDAVKEAKDHLELEKSSRVLHICEIREVKQVKRSKR